MPFLTPRCNPLSWNLLIISLPPTLNYLFSFRFGCFWILREWKHTVCILQLAFCFISLHHHRVPLYKYTAVCLGILLLDGRLADSSMMNSASWNNLIYVSWCPRVGASVCLCYRGIFEARVTHTVNLPRKSETLPKSVPKFHSHQHRWALMLLHTCANTWHCPTFSFLPIQWIWDSFSL